ncbi:putative ABC transport system permease protein [Bradyrhizobium sp. CIR18]|uniref:ABC transporter permease n=1 Tax=Bradyrhizobium sp. CIR18 TaxID=2663839 RepID=UPI001606BB84|nr:ABC transporter permease [Bradyrhizobium sp. CIR18]MBB4363503.1 putative ABC transport system permease protein [Bradyrhizobium sp. CIR18]
MKLVNSTLAALRAVRVNKLRSALTMLGIVLGVSSVTVMMGVGGGASQRIQTEMRNLGANTIVLNSGALKSRGVSKGQGSRPSVTPADAQAIENEVPTVIATSPQHNFAGMQLIYGNANWSTLVTGTTPEYLIIRNWTVSRGRAFDREDVLQGSKVVMLGRTVAEKLFGNESPVGQEIRVNRVPMTVIGELAAKGQSLAGIDTDDTAVIPISTALNRVIGRNPANPRAISGVILKVRDGANMASAFTEIRQVVRQRHGLLPAQEDDFHLINLTEVMRAKEDSARALGILLAAIASVSLLVGGIGIMNIMLVSVTERIREIGLRLAVGARRSDILGQFLVEATILSLIGGIAGVALGLGGAVAVERYANLGVVLNGQLSLVAMTFAAGVGIFFGFYPAWKASLLQPVEALRSD